MARKDSGGVCEFFSHHRMVFLLGAILSLIIGSPFLDDVFPYGIVPDVLLSLTIILCIHAISRTRTAPYIAAGLALPTFLGIWSSHVLHNTDFYLIGEFFGAIFCGFIIALLVRFILTQEAITKEVIYAAVIVYLLMGIMWSFLYFILDYFYPKSFSFAQSDIQDIYQYMYFSFVTITTLGFGDVSPLTHKAGSLVILEAVTGQIYLVVVLAWLVGMHVSRRSR